MLIWIILQQESFASFSLSWYDGSDREEAESALQACRSFAEHFTDSTEETSSYGKNLCIYGSVGVGKTFLTHCIAGELLSKSCSVLYLSAFSLFDMLSRYTFHSREELKEAHEAVFTCDLLIIDDLGTELGSSFVSSQLFLIINERILSRRSTVLSTNLTLEGIRGAFSERTFSRIIGNYQLIHLSGRDIRIRRRIAGGDSQNV